MTIHQQISFKCDPATLYTALTDSREFATATGAPAETSASEGKPFSLFGGQITGRNVEMKKNEMIVQAWRAGAWPAGHYSMVRFVLEGKGKKTTLTMDHTGYPEGEEKHLDGGWQKMYWDPLKAHCD